MNRPLNLIFLNQLVVMCFLRDVSARLARRLLSRYPYFPWLNFPSIGMRSRYSCRRCAFRRSNSSLFSGVIFGGRPSGLPAKRILLLGADILRAALGV